MKRIIIYGGSFDPPHRSHRQIVQRLAASCDKLIVIPCGPRAKTSSATLTGAVHRKAMLEMAFGDLKGAELDLFDLENETFTSTSDLDQRYRRLFPKAEILHAVGADLVTGGKNATSEIQRWWHKGKEIWQTLKFLVIARPGYSCSADDMPPHAQCMEITDLEGSGTLIRQRIAEGLPVTEFLLPEVWEYIKEHRLYEYTPEG